MQKPITTLLNWSGGLDSTYCLYEWLNNKNNFKERLLLHHIDLVNRSKRYIYERKAVSNCLDWLDNNGFKNRYKYIETKFDYGPLVNCIFDIQLVGFISGIVMKDFIGQTVTKIIRCTPIDEYERLGKERMDNRHLLAKTTREIVCNRPVEILTPMSGMNKRDVWTGTPEGLRKLTWSCRLPTQDGETCITSNRKKFCHTCEQLTLQENKAFTKSTIFTINGEE